MFGFLRKLYAVHEVFYALYDLLVRDHFSMVWGITFLNLGGACVGTGSLCIDGFYYMFE